MNLRLIINVVNLRLIMICDMREVRSALPSHNKFNITKRYAIVIIAVFLIITKGISTSTSKSLLKNYTVNFSIIMRLKLFHRISLHCKYSNLCWKSWLVHVHWNNKTCTRHTIYDWYCYCKHRDYCLFSNIRRTQSQMFLVSSCSCLCPIYWSQVLSWEWRCSWSSADRRCSYYIWVINNFIAY